MVSLSHLRYVPNATLYSQIAALDFSRIFRRDCVQCDASTPLTCPTCPSGQVCIQVSPTCDQCASRKCVPSAASGANTNVQPSHDSGPSIGAIVGGVIGGIVFVAILVFCLWFFVIRKRRQQWEAAYVQEYDEVSERSSQRDTFSPAQRARSENTRSIASTAYTRSSNVIQIAFIPGVTDRNDGFAPPVPPIPSQANSPWSDSSDDHYFMPGDLRDSTYSGFTDDGASTIDRRSMARSIAPSIAPSLLRESIASHAYHEDAIANPMPAQTALRGRANMVSVKSGSNTPNVTPVPNPDRTRFPIAIASGSSSNRHSGIPTTTTSTTHRPEPLISIDSAPIPTIQVSSDSASDTTDAMSVRSGAPHIKSAIEEATRRASSQPTHGGLGSVRPSAAASANRDPSPFSDANRISTAASVESSPRSFHSS